MLGFPVAVAIAAAVLAALPASAAVLSQTRALSTGIGAPAVVVFDPYDPSLGDLTRVDVALSGLMTVQAFAAPLPDGLGGFLPYSFSILSKLGAVSPGGTGFEWDGEAQWLTSPTVPGTGSQVASTSPFEFEFTFDGGSDVTGFATLASLIGFTQPPLSVNGRRSDFIESLANQVLGIQQMFFVPEPPQVLGAPAAVTILGLDFDGSIRLDYTYQARQGVPEPGSAMLLAPALAALLAARCRRIPVT